MRPNRKWYTFDTSQSSIRSGVFNSSDPMKIHLMCFVLPSVMYGNQMILSDEIIYGTFVLQNFHTSEDRDQRIYLPNSCGVDSILHGLMCLYIDIPICRHVTCRHMQSTIYTKFMSRDQEF